MKSFCEWLWDSFDKYEAEEVDINDEYMENEYNIIVDRKSKVSFPIKKLVSYDKLLIELYEDFENIIDLDKLARFDGNVYKFAQNIIRNLHSCDFMLNIYAFRDDPNKVFLVIKNDKGFFIGRTRTFKLLPEFYMTLDYINLHIDDMDVDENLKKRYWKDVEKLQNDPSWFLKVLHEFSDKIFPKNKQTEEDSDKRSNESQSKEVKSRAIKLLDDLDIPSFFIKNVDITRQNGSNGELQVLPSSVTGAGFGVYALAPFKKGSVIPVFYRGIVSDPKTEDFLLDIVNRFESGEKITTKDTEKLLRQFKISINDVKLSKDKNYLVFSDEKKDSSDINWPNVLSSYYNYAFETPKGLLVWPVYDYAGNPVLNWKNPNDYALFFNEPPPCQNYYNRLLQTTKKTKVNVAAKQTKSGAIGFEAIEDIEPGEELFICYGPLYAQREYKINMDKDFGCGRTEMIDSWMNEEKKTGKFSERLYKRGLGRDKTRVLNYFKLMDSYKNDVNCPLTIEDEQPEKLFEYARDAMSSNTKSKRRKNESTLSSTESQNESSDYERQDRTRKISQIQKKK